MTDTSTDSSVDPLSRFRRGAAWMVALTVIGWVGYAAVRGFSDTAEELGSYRWGGFVAALGLTLVNYGLRYVKWAYLLRQLDVHVQHRHNVPIFLAGLAMTISPAKAGEIVKPYLVREVHGAEMAQTIPALVAERGTDGLAVALLAAIGVTTYAAEATWAIWGTFAAALVLLALISAEPVPRAAIRLVRRISAAQPLADRLDVAYRATRALLAPGPFVLTVLLSMVAWFCECLGTWLIFKGTDMVVSLDLSTFLYAFSTVFGAPSPGGLGMADLALAEGTLNLVDGATPGQALAATLLVRVATLWLGVVLGAVALLRIEHVIQDARRSAA